MSAAHRSWSPVESTDRPMIFTPRRSNSGLILAMYPSSVVHTGVKSFGCENSTAHESPAQSWKRIHPSVVSASKSGAVSPSCRVIAPPRVGKDMVSATLEGLRSPAVPRHVWMVPSYEIGLLGRFVVRVDGQPVPASAWRHKRAAELVKILALADPHRLHCEQVMDLLWPDLAS